MDLFVMAVVLLVVSLIISEGVASKTTIDEFIEEAHKQLKEEEEQAKLEKKQADIVSQRKKMYLGIKRHPQKKLK